MNTQNENQEPTAHCFDPFPEPQTIPSGWDTSTFYATPVAASASEADTSGEGESC
jgi:hypothetical protein